jgi:hypothetical protein
MKTKFDQKNFNLILKGTTILTKVVQVVIMIGIVVLVLLSLGALVIPSDLYIIDLSLINAFSVNIGTMNMEIPIEQMEGTLNIRYLMIFASATILVFFGAFYYLFKKVEHFLGYVKNGTPFADENIHMMYHIGKVLVVLSVLLPVASYPFAWRLAHVLP